MSAERLGPFLLRQPPGVFSLGEDALRLAAFATVRRSWKVCDLGTGSGCLLLLLSGRATGLDLYGVELDPTAARAARDNLMENGLGGTVWTGDWNTLPGGTGPFDLVVSNPPYFAQGSGASGGPARMEGRDGLESLCRTAARLTRNGGRFALCHRPERLTDLLCALRVCGLEPKRLQLATHALDRPPSLVLVEAVRQGRPGLEVLPALYRAGPGGREEGA